MSTKMQNKYKYITKEELRKYFVRFVNFIIRYLRDALRLVYFYLNPPDTFYFNGEAIEYFRHNYNSAYANERTIEIAIVKNFLDKMNSNEKILEVGNVLNNYSIRLNQDVLDKYDHAPGVINEDVISFAPIQKYDVIVSISTLEHVGWDEEVRDESKIIRAVNNLVLNCLAPGGTMIVSIPLGYNAFFDNHLKNEANYLPEKYFLKRISKENKWEQVDYSEVMDAKFGEPFNNANVICIGIIHA